MDNFNTNTTTITSSISTLYNNEQYIMVRYVINIMKNIIQLQYMNLHDEVCSW